MSLDEELEPTAWPERPAALREFDCACRCPICHDLFDTPKSLPCGHSFCHSCISSNLEYQMHTRTQGRPACPSCRADADLMDLRLNHSLAHMVKCFLAVRPTLIQAVKGHADQAVAAGGGGGKGTGHGGASPGQTPPLPSMAQAGGPPTERRTSSRKRLRTPSAPSVKVAADAVAVVEDSGESSEDEDEDEDPDFAPTSSASLRSRARHAEAATPAPPIKSTPRRPPPGKVECPICSGFFPQGEVAQRHVDVCLIRGSVGASASGAPAGNCTPSVAIAAHFARLKKLPKLAFRLLKMGQLMDAVKRAGLPVTADGKPGSGSKASREVLEKRYTELRREIDRALDSKENVSIEELVRKVITAERQLLTATKLGAFQAKYTTPPSIAGAGKDCQGGASGDCSYEALIQNMRERQGRNAKKATIEAPPCSDVGDGRELSEPHGELASAAAAAAAATTAKCFSERSSPSTDETEQCVVIDDSDVVVDSDDGGSDVAALHEADAYGPPLQLTQGPRAEAEPVGV